MALSFLTGLSACSSRCYLKSDETVNFFPAYVYKAPEGWQAVLRGEVVHPTEQSLVYQTALKALNAALFFAATADIDTALLQERFLPFTAEGRGGKAVPVEIAGRRHVLAKSMPSGYFQDVLPITPLGLTTTALDYTTDSCRNDARRFTGKALVIPATGLSVVTNVEDTLRITQMGDRQAVLSNLFMREYKSVPGMAERYSAWASSQTVFHYLSAGPWQLTLPLQTFLQNEGFPDGTLHLQTLPSAEAGLSLNSMLDVASTIFQPPATYETPMIEELLQRFPQRRFVLIGSSGQKDPEIFAALARRYPDQIRAIYIRELSSAAETARWSRVFHGLSPKLWQIFKSPDEMPTPERLSRPSSPASPPPTG